MNDATYPPEVTALAGDLIDRSVVYLTGSHMYGLNTPDSDHDYTVIFHDPVDDRCVFRQYPDVLHSAGNDHKMYSLRKFAELLPKGNPNAVELAARHRDVQQSFTLSSLPSTFLLIDAFMTTVQPYLVTQNLLSAYMGHVTQVQSEMTKKGVTPKRLSHALRLAACAQELMRVPTFVPDFRLSAWYETALDLKTGRLAQSEGEDLFNRVYGNLLRQYHDERPTLPFNADLRDAINGFFIGASGSGA
ncbi:DNA polymerase beta superfamily protein [Deinococcus soli (ex Cha et al. 2016)]|uniref:DNA polymerase beta superfamily protein n=1 Tax=Deinococcus soli (ex Cha et al. 2016) TaxID=1309411 RepID=UPI00166473F8|nr:nucleotidyltransferase domain-containing protein [Deinococcus soli (ex Cha et al. 2016)]GGB69321.1 hypothetical protein GCM10008019_26880 [Deinococcus soli (ex Cha et al. 2016)]